MVVENPYESGEGELNPPRNQLKRAFNQQPAMSLLFLILALGFLGLSAMTYLPPRLKPATPKRQRLQPMPPQGVVEEETNNPILR